MTRVYTVGHSNRDADALIALLRRHDIENLIDVRAFPRSRRHPHFNRALIGASLTGAGIGYHWRGEDLGGFRKPRAGSRNSALTDAAFRGFADYMASARFAAAATAVLEQAARQRVAIMCAEADHHHCHRQFIADYLVQRGAAVLHLRADGTVSEHHLNPCLDPTSDPPVYNRHEQGDLFGQSLP